MNEQNLIPFSKRSESEAREFGSKGGKKSGAARRKKRDMKKCMDMLLSLPASSLEDYQLMSDMGVSFNELSEDEITNMLVVNSALLRLAKKGDVSAIKELRDIIGDSELYKQKNRLEKEKLRLEREKFEYEKSQNETGENTGTVYNGIPASLVAPAFLPLIFDIEEHLHSEHILPGGRGSGKSSFISLAVIDLLMKHTDMHACVLRQVGNTLRDTVYSQIMWAISVLGLENEFHAAKTPLEITRISTGQKIYFRGADDPNKLKSIKPPFGYVGIIWFEELDQFGGDEAVRKIEQSVIRGGDKAYKFKSFNPPKSAQNWANKYSKLPNDNKLVTESNYLSVPKKWLGEAFLNDAEYLKEINPAAYENEYLGVANGTGGAVFDNVVPREVTDDEISRFDYIYHGIDWGWYPDPFAYVRMTYIPRTQTLIIFDEYRCNKKSNAETAEELRRKGVSDNDLITCDSAEPKSVADYRTYGLFARGAEKGPDSVNYSMKWLQSLREIVIDPKRCPETCKEFTEYEYERSKSGEIISGYPDKDNHSIDAVRYAMERVWRRGGN